MNGVLDFNLCAIAVLSMLLFAAIFRKMTKGTTGRIFLTLLSVTFLSAFFAAASVRMENVCEANPAAATDFYIALRYAVHYGYLLFHTATPLMYIMYIISLTDTWHRLRYNWGMTLLIVIPIILIVILLMVNLVTKGLFYIDSSYQYTRGTLFPLLYIFSFTYLVYGFIYLFNNKNLFTSDKLWSLYLIFPLTLIAVLFQWLNKDAQIEMFTNAIALLLITITVERPEQRIDSITELLKLSAYAADMKKGFSTDKHVVIIAVNIGNYQSIFDILGFDSFSELMRSIANDLTVCNRTMHTKANIYYLDRGRFRVVLNDNHKDDANKLAEQVNSLFLKSYSINGLELDLRAHVCLLRCPEDIGDFKSLMAFGEDFHTKQPFSGTVTDIAELSGTAKLNLTNKIDSIVDKAITNRSFKVYYQPIYSLKEKRFVSAEALLRLIDDNFGFIPPDIFIQAAEKSGAIIRIGEIVLEDVCRFISEGACSELGLDYIEINLSVAQCMQSDLAESILSTLERFNVSPDKINLEITESAASYAQNIMTANLERLTNQNVSFSLDDYGTGYSNIKRVVSLPLKIVKLDKTYVNEMDNPRMWTVLKNTVKMLKEMNMEIVVEGVETKEISDKFEELRCDYIQGYYYSRPLPEKDFIDFMKNAAKA